MSRRNIYFIFAILTFYLCRNEVALSCPISAHQQVNIISTGCIYVGANPPSGTVEWRNGTLTIESGIQVGSSNANVATVYVFAGASLSTFVNYGKMDLAGKANLYLSTNASITEFNNQGIMRDYPNAISLQNGSSITNLINAGTIDNNTGSVGFNDLPRIYLDNATIQTITNTGNIINYTVATSDNNSSGIANKGGIINIINNFGTISGASTSYGINNSAYGVDGRINTLNNAQGQRYSSDAALTYNGKLPSFYNVVVNGTGYGKLQVSNAAEPAGSGSLMQFGVYSGSTLSRNKQTYSSVLSGVSSSLLSPIRSGTINGRSWALVQGSQNDVWDLIIEAFGPDVWNTYKTLTSNRDALLGAMHQRYAVLNTVMEYDCNRFDKYGVCISFQARSTGWGTQTTGAGVLNIAYRIHPKIRAGAYLDYQVAQGTTFGTSYGTGGIQNGFNNPTFGGYVGYTQDKDGTGLQARASGGYNSGKITITRALLEDTEGGSGNAALNAYYAYGTFGYGIKIAENSIVAPYSGLLYTNVIRNSYTENYNALVLYPLAYNSFYEQLITGVGGLKLTSMLTDKLGCQFGVGTQFDLKRTANGYGGYSYIPGMEAYGIAHGGSWNGKRPTAQAGAFYNVSKNEQLVINAYAGQQAFTTRTYTSLLAGYQISF